MRNGVDMARGSITILPRALHDGLRKAQGTPSGFPGERSEMTHRSRARGLFCCAIACMAAVLALVPADAFAWGPGVHMATANWLFANTGVLPALTGQLIASHREAFLYGCLSADIFIGKGCAFKPGHSHNWETGRRLLDSARAPRLKAYALGYLSHLAADIVAHNNYVPAMLSATPGSGKLSHVYIEAQADRLVRWDTRIALRLFDNTHAKDADSTLCSATSAGRVPFMLKKQVFKHSVALAGGMPWRTSLRLFRRIAPEAQDTELFGSMMDASLRAVVSVLSDPYDSPVTGLDPIGEQSLRDAKALCCGRAPFAFRKPFPLRFPLHPALAGLAALPRSPLGMRT